MKHQLSIYYYTDPNKFLSDFWNEKKKLNNNFTIRAWAKKMGLKSHNSLYEAIRGKRSIPKSYLPKIQTSSGLNEKEMNYFEALIDFKKAKGIEEKEFYAHKIQKLKGRNNLQFTEIQTFKILKDPLNAIILEMATQDKFQADVNWIFSKLKIKTTKSQIKQALELLISEKYLIQDPKNDQFRKANKNITSTENIEDIALKEFHNHLSDISKEQIKKQPVNERDYRGTILNIEPHKISEAKKKLQIFMGEFINEFECKKEDQPTKSYCLHTKLFALTEEI